MSNKKLTFKYAAMSSGKTLSIIATYYSYKQFNINILLIKPGKDTKGNKNLISRNGNTIPVDFIIDEKDDIRNKLANTLLTNNIQCIIVDEAQFLSEIQIDQLSDIVDYHNIDIICYGLRADFQNKPFPGSMRLFCIADEIQPLDLKARCRCGEIAIMNTRKINDEFVFEGNQIAIDGESNITYQSLCRKCYKEEEQKDKEKSKIKKLLKE